MSGIQEIHLLIATLLTLLQIDAVYGGWCTKTTCELNFWSSDDYCCNDGDCCSYTEYAAEQAVGIFKLSIGAIVGIAIGSIVLLIACIVGCVCCCCNQGRSSNRGTVLAATTTTTHPPVVVQQHPAAYQPYPPTQGYPPPQGQFYSPQPAQPPYNPHAMGAPPPYENKTPY